MLQLLRNCWVTANPAREDAAATTKATPPLHWKLRNILNVLLHWGWTKSTDSSPPVPNCTVRVSTRVKMGSNSHPATLAWTLVTTKFLVLCMWPSTPQLGTFLVANAPSQHPIPLTPRPMTTTGTCPPPHPTASSSKAHTPVTGLAKQVAPSCSDWPPLAPAGQALGLHRAPTSELPWNPPVAAQ